MQLRKIFVAALPIIIIVPVTLFFLKSPFAKGEPNYTETTYYFLTDHLGSVDVVLDDEGNVVERADYLPFGSDRLRVSDADAPENDYKFTGKEKDDETELFYYGARYYDSEIGRFISEDPWEGDLTNPQTLNKYSYVNNNPITFVDPTGMWGVSWITGSEAHQILTTTSLGMANIDQSWKDSHEKQLIWGASVYADIVVKFAGETDASFHSTVPSDITSAIDLKDRMMGNAKRFYESSSTLEFGRLIHMVQDSYCPSHVKRDENGNITAFYDYEKQKKLEHIQGDSIKNADLSSLTGAAEAAKTLIEYRANPDVEWGEIKNYLDNTVWKLSENATIDTAGEENKKDEDEN